MADVVPHGKQICPSMILHVPFVVLLFGAVLPSRDANDRRQDNAKKNYIVGFESTGILPSDVELLVGGVDKAHLRQLDNEGSVHLMALTEEQSQKVSLHCVGGQTETRCILLHSCLTKQDYTGDSLCTLGIRCSIV